MNKWKLIFTQGLMISSGTFFCLGVSAFILYILYGEATVSWPWYFPLSIILHGFLCAFPTLLLLDNEGLNTKQLRLRIVIHFFLLLGIVSLCGFIFNWYTIIAGYVIVVIMYVVIYIFVWAVTMWISKADEKMINALIDEIRDEE